jgi:hypothetical protein
LWAPDWEEQPRRSIWDLPSDLPDYELPPMDGGIIDDPF